MPKTKFQSIVFTAIMVFCMVFCMTVYTIALKFGGLSYQVFGLAICEMWVEYVVVYLLIFFVITRTAQKLAFRIVTPGVDKPIFIILSIQCFTVCLIVPCITFEVLVTFSTPLTVPSPDSNGSVTVLSILSGEAPG